MEFMHRMIVPVPMVFVDDVDETPVDAKLYLKTDSRSNRIYD